MKTKFSSPLSSSWLVWLVYGI